MITAVVTFKLPDGFTREQYAQNAQRVAPRFQAMPGLIRKQFIYDAESGRAGGVYLWESREAAEACYGGPWRETLRTTYGVEPEITWFESPVVVDNESQAVKIAA